MKNEEQCCVRMLCANNRGRPRGRPFFLNAANLLDNGIKNGIDYNMNSKHRKTLAAIFSSPVPRSLPFRDMEGLLRAVGCVVEEKPGSAVGFAKDGCNVGFHRPHPGKEAKPYQIKDARDFLRRIGVAP